MAPTSRGIVLLTLFLACQADDVEDALGLSEGSIQEEVCKVAEYGGIGDGITKDTASIQKAIDACGQKKLGGVVELEAEKTYLSGQLNMAAQVTLRIPKGSVLLASIERADYGIDQADWTLIKINKVTRVSIEGPGKISGQASRWQTKYQGKLEYRSWVDEECMGQICRPHLISVREASQVTFQDITLEKFVHFAINVVRSEAVAVILTQISTKMNIPGTQGIVVDGSKRVFIGQTNIVCSDNAISATTTTSNKILESLLVDDVVIETQASGFQVGPVARAEIRTIVAQNMAIVSAHRGLAVQLQDVADIHDIWFTNVTILSKHMESPFFGSAEAVHVSVKPLSPKSSLGKMSNIWFGNISAESEGGLIFSGDEDSTIDGITVKDSSLELTKQTPLKGSIRDFRPSYRGVVNASATAAIFVENANHVQLSSLNVTFGTPHRADWGGLLEMTPHTVHSLQFGEVHMHDEAAHPSAPFPTQMKTFVQLGDFFRHSVPEWIKSINQKGFISLQENAAFGVSGRRAASSGSPLVMGLLFFLLVFILVRYCCLPKLRERRRARSWLP